MGRTRDRASAAGLLPRMEARPWADGKTVTYRYNPVGKRPVNLGTDLAAALRKVLDMNGQPGGPDPAGTLRWGWESFKANSPRWKKYAQTTRDDYEMAWKQLNERLGHMHVGEITTAIVARYIHMERADARRRADIEKSLLSRLFGHAIILGLCAVNPTTGVEPHGSESRTVAVNPAVLGRYLAWLEQQTPQRRIIGMAAEYASLAGNRKVEFLPLFWTQIDEVAGEVRSPRAKQRGKMRGEVIEVIKITPNLQRLIDRLKALRAQRGVDCLYVFPTRDNNAYTARGFKTLWQRCVLLAIEQGVITKEDRFTFHDLRAYYATMHKKDRGHLPNMHKNAAVTAQVYDRSREVPREAL